MVSRHVYLLTWTHELDVQIHDLLLGSRGDSHGVHSDIAADKGKCVECGVWSVVWEERRLVVLFFFSFVILFYS